MNNRTTDDKGHGQNNVTKTLGRRKPNIINIGLSKQRPYENGGKIRKK